MYCPTCMCTYSTTCFTNENKNILLMLDMMMYVVINHYLKITPMLVSLIGIDYCHGTVLGSEW